MERVQGTQGVVVRWRGNYVIVWSVEYNHSFIVINDSVDYDRDELYATNWLSFDVNPKIVDSPEGPCTQAFNPHSVDFRHSLNPETTEYDYNDFNSFVYRFTEYNNTIRFKTRLRRYKQSPGPVLFDPFIGDVDVSTSEFEQLVKHDIFDVDVRNFLCIRVVIIKWFLSTIQINYVCGGVTIPNLQLRFFFSAIIELKHLARPGERPVWYVVSYVLGGKEISLTTLLYQLGKKLHGPGGVVMERDQVVIPPDTLRPTVGAMCGAAPSMFAAKLTREERLRRNATLSLTLNDDTRQQTYCENGNAKPWGQLSSTSMQSAIEQTINMDCIIVFRKMIGTGVQFYVIFSKTHRFGVLCDGGIKLDLGKWARLQYIGSDFKPGQYLSSRSLRLINYIAPPRFVDAKKFKMREVPDDIAEYIVILTLRARISNYGNGDLIIESDDVGPVKVDVEWTPSSPIPHEFPRGAVIEIEFVRDSWYLRKLHGHWHDGLDLRRLESPYIWPGYTVEEFEFRGKRYAHGVEACVERSIQRRSFTEEPRRENHSAWSGPRQDQNCFDVRTMDDVPGTRSELRHECGCKGQRCYECDRNAAEDKNGYGHRDYPTRGRDSAPPALNETLPSNSRRRVHAPELENKLQKKTTHGEEKSTRDHMSYSFRLPDEPSSSKQTRDDYYFDKSYERDYEKAQKVDDLDGRESGNRANIAESERDVSDGSRDPPEEWIPPALPPNDENVVDLTDEKPSGRDRCPAWCCVVKIRHDHVICYAPIPGIHKIVIPRELLDISYQRSIRLGSWMNVMCEPRCKREYDDYRIPHFSHIAVEVCAAPEVAPPLEGWEQREIHGIIQFRVCCNLNVVGNVQRVQVGNEKWLKLACRHTLLVLVPYERLEGILSAQLTADKTIKFWATRKKRVLDCDLFLMDFETIEEV